MAHILKKVFNIQDVLARLGGDEFIIISAETDFSFIPKMKEHIKESCEEWYIKTHSPFHLSISIGAVEFNEKNSDLDTLLSQADKVLYEEKEKKHTRSALKD